MNKDYKALANLSTHARVLQGVMSLLDWDQETYMPPGSSEIRGEQLKVMAGIIHKEKTSRKWANALGRLVDVKSGKIKGKGLTSEQTAAVREWRSDFHQDTALPQKFVEEFSKTTSQAIIAWRAAKQNNRFKEFLPHLERIVSLNQKKAEFFGYTDHPYDALLNQYEPGVKTKEINALFTALRKELIPLIKKAAKRKVDDSFLFGNWSEDKQIAFGNCLLEGIGYSRETGRLDLSAHPFSSACHPTDSRITTRIDPKNFASNIFAVLHEAGHGFYEMGLPVEHYGTPLGDARSLGVHESQSRWWETRIGMSRPFWQHFLPLLKKTFKGKLEKVSLDHFMKAINKVESSLIRIEADELTYPLHIILRFELEKGLIEGKIKVKELPEMWKEMMQEYLGVTPKTDAEGCLQDIHWSMGAFGYFPTYTLGNLYAGHLFDRFEDDYPNWEREVAAGHFDFIKEWLSEKIYIHGKRYPTQELLKLATGKPFSAAGYLRYLKAKYG